VFIWLAFALNFDGLDNAFVKLSNAKFVGYSIPELFGSSYKDSVSDQILCLKIVFSLLILGYSLYFLALFSIDDDSRRIRLLFLGFSLQLLASICLFWIKFIKDNHIVDNVEKRELFIATASCIFVSLICYAFSTRSVTRRSLKAKHKLPSVKTSNKTPSLTQVSTAASSGATEAKNVDNNEQNINSPDGENREIDLQKLEDLPQLETILTPNSAQDDGEDKVEVSNENETETEQNIDGPKSNEVEVDEVNLSAENLNSPSTSTNVEEIDDSETAGPEQGPNLTIGASEKE
jgi:hypothetical protein